MHGWQVTPLAVVTGLGTSRGPRLCLSGFLMHTSNRSGFRHWPRSASETNRTAVYGPVCTVVWQGSAGNRCPYADQQNLSVIRIAAKIGGGAPEAPAGSHQIS